jgi:hypothetical protein
MMNLMRNGGDIVEKYTLNDISSKSVVVDGSNVMTIGDQDANGHILNSCKLFLEQKGAKPILCVNKNTFYWMVKRKLPGWEILEKMKENGVVKLYENDDLYIIHLALKLDALIITKDTFEDWNGKKRERSKYPDLDWDDIDKRTWGTNKSKKGRVLMNEDWMVVESEFVMAKFPPEKASVLSGKYKAIRESYFRVEEALHRHNLVMEIFSDDEKIKDHKKQIYDLSSYLRRIKNDLPSCQIPQEDELLSMNKDALKDKVTDMQPRDIALSNLGLKSSGNRFFGGWGWIPQTKKSQEPAMKVEVTDMQPRDLALSILNKSLRNGKEIRLHVVYNEIKRVVLGDKKAKGKNGGKSLRSKLKYSKKFGFLNWLLELSNNKLQYRRDGGKVFIRYG